MLDLLWQEGYSTETLARALNLESGLLGVSGVSSDMRRVLEARAAGHERAKLAFDLFVHRLRASLGGMMASLGGMDAVVFTGGIGENAPEVRQAACEPFGFLGLKLDLERNSRRSKDEDVAAAGFAERVLVIQAQDDWSIARGVRQICGNQAAPRARRRSPGRSSRNSSGTGRYPSSAEMYRRQLADLQVQRQLRRLDRRLLAVASQLGRIAKPQK